ncbi:interferon-inducible GTPase 5-like [Podarcis lilfordi]|uniref:Interferon-inducible GTPase 5-like n=1 Tax=Podarcis lilfordi TaxID=74358 RepID=A0AA35PCS9_9SAUR|nr:interferon-inducible GTPase 5-like [Podarcis lilfordi]
MERSYPNTFSEEEVLEKMRNDFKKQLEKWFRNTFPQVFLISSWDLRKLAKLAKKPVEELKAVIKSPQRKEITRDLVIKKITDYAKELFPPSLVRSLVAAGVSFATTYWMLSSFVDNLAEDAERVRKKALGLEECEAEHLRAK